MKKLFFSIVAILTLVLSVYADTTAQCKISGSNDGATVVAAITEVGDGYVMVILENDGTFAVNVQVSISSVSCGCGSTMTKVYPSESRVVKVPVQSAKSSYNVGHYTIRVSGARCK